MNIPLIIFADEGHLDKINAIIKEKRTKNIPTIVFPIN